MKYLMYMYGGSKNHGCEALVRSTVKIMGEAEAVLSSGKPEDDAEYGLNNIAAVGHDGKPMRKYEPYHFLSSFSLRFLQNADLNCARVYYSLFRRAEGCRVALSIGGDNYCYPYYPAILKSLNRRLSRSGCKTVLWGCSIEPELLKSSSVVEDLKRYALITARESVSYRALIKAGVGKNTKLFPDPAFQLDAVELPLPRGFADGNTVGINISPLILGYEKNSGMAYRNYQALIRHIIRETDMQVALIPHVVQPNNDDRTVLKRLYDEFRETGRVVLLGDHNCMELKGYIARCRVFVCARTHASIAAYSSCVPTLVVGYSVKAKGIAQDIFGTCEDYVIPVQSLAREDELTGAFDRMMRRERQIRDHLQRVMPGYCARGMEAGEEIRKLTGESN